MKILVMGAGAIGSVFGGLLAEQQHDVSLIGRKRYMDIINESGLKISGIFGEHNITNLKTFVDSASITERAFDVIFIATKSFDTENAVKGILSLMGESTLVISLQNGLGNVETISRMVGAERTVGGRVIFGVELVEPGHFKVTVIADKVLMGSPGGKADGKKLEEIARALSTAGIPTETTADITKYIWQKVLYNGCLNPLSAILDVSYGQLGELTATKEIITEIISETFSVAACKNIDLGFASAAEYEKLLFGKLLPATASHHSSMLQDVRNGRKTEIDAINGAIVQIGEEIGIATPVNWMLTRLLHAQENLTSG